MILQLKQPLSSKQRELLENQWQAVCFEQNGETILVLPAAVQQLPVDLLPLVKMYWVMTDEIQLASVKFQPQLREVKVGDLVLGGTTGNTVMITGPCSVENERQIEEAAKLCVKLGVKVLRAGAYKPRTSPYSFQGLGLKGLQLLSQMRQRYGLKIITEARDSSHIHEVIEHSDIVQVGAKAMYDQGILRACARSQKPVLIKRGFGSTVQEWVQAAEFVLSGGNSQVLLCERGIRTFENKTRFTLDLCAVAWVKEHTNLPVVLDPSHAMGYAYGVSDLAKACMAMGVDGLLIETHPNPAAALSDAAQQLDFEQFSRLYMELKPIAAAVGRNMV